MPPTNGSDFRFVTNGIGAQTSEYVVARFDVDIAPLKPDVVIVQVGINDLKGDFAVPSTKGRHHRAVSVNIEMDRVSLVP